MEGADANAWIDSTYSDASICYKLATPQLVTTLTPQQITSFLETNTIWSNADSVEVTYPVIPTCNLEKSRHNILASYPHKETAESTDGAMDSFSTDMVGPMMDLRVGFGPIQSGEGTPSPENVRAIGGWDGLTLARCGKNLLTNEVVYRSANNNTFEYTLENDAITMNVKASGASNFVLIKIFDEITPSMVGLCIRYSASIINTNDAFVTCNADGSNRTSLGNSNRIATITSDHIGKVLTLRWYAPSSAIGTYTASNMQVEIVPSISSEATLYEPSNINKFDVIFPPFGKNYWNPEYMASSGTTYTTTNTGIIVTSSSAGTFRYVVFKTSNITSNDIGKTYTFSTNAIVTSGQARILISIRNSDGTSFRNMIEKASDVNQTLSGSFTIPSDFPDNGYLRYAFYCTGSAGGSGEVEYSNTQLELGSSTTTYEKYIPLYGGYVDPIAGEIVAEYHIVHFVRNYISGVIQSGFPNASQYYALSATIGDAASLKSKRELAICDKMKTIQSDLAKPELQPMEGILVNERRWMFGLPSGITTLEEARNWIDEIGGFDLCYPIAEPIHYPIDSHTLLTLRGANNIWSTANGDIVAIYYTHGDQSTQWLPGKPIIDDNDMILTTSNGYAIGKEDDYIVY